MEVYYRGSFSRFVSLDLGRKLIYICAYVMIVMSFACEVDTFCCN